VSERLQHQYVKSSSMVHRQIADEVILVPIRRDVADLDSIYALDGAGPRIWELIDGVRSVGDIIDCIAEEYDVDPDTAESDVREFVSQLEALAAVKRSA
jgi:hypothetical protein